MVRLASLAERLEALSAGPIRVDAARCIHARVRQASCDACTRACPSGAVQHNAALELDAGTCAACGACVPACPAGALAADDGLADLLECVARLQGARVIELACVRHPAPRQGAAGRDAVVCTQGCLAALGPSAYLRLITLGLRRVFVRLDACAGCPIGQVQAAIEAAIAAAQDSLAPGSPAAIVGLTRVDETQQRPVYSAKNPPVSRRDWFRLFLATSSREAGRAVAGAAGAPGEGERVSTERRRYVHALRQLPVARARVLPASVHCARITAGESCAACGVCAQICPTGALAFEAGAGDGYRLSFACAECIDCGACLKVCRPRALQRQDATPDDLLSEQAVVLRAGRLRACARCGAKYAADGAGELCSICASRRRPAIPLHI